MIPRRTPENPPSRGREGASLESVSTHVSSQVQEHPELARLIEAWPTLPEPMRAGILAMVDTASKR